MRAIATAAAVAIVGCLAAPGQVWAAWPGTPGRIAWLSGAQGTLKVVDPTPGAEEPLITVAETTPVNAGAATFDGFGASAPAWSPDGTTLAFASAVDDPGIGHGFKHTAIFTWNVETGAIHQVTTPPPGYPACGGATPCEREDEYLYADTSPAWSPDGKSIAFVRILGAGKESVHYSERGGDVWSAKASGGGEARMVSVGTANYITSLAWGGDPNGSTALVGVKANNAEEVSLVRLDGGLSTLIGSIVETPLEDYDVAPDGRHVEYLGVSGSGVTLHQIGINGGSNRTLGTVTSSYLRASPSGNGPIVSGFAQLPSGRVSGLVEYQAKEAGRDQWSEDPPDRFLYPPSGFSSPTTGGLRIAWDVQPLHLPIIAIPGYAGSKLYCNGKADWLISSADPLHNVTPMRELALDSSGKSPNCPGAGPNSKAESEEGIVSEGFGKKIYKPLLEFMSKLGDSEQHHVFSWDWRKAPGDSVARLKHTVEHVLNGAYARAEGAHQVVFYAHSYGGLLIRQYAEDHPTDVARVLTVGTPYWGAPKSLFAIAFGIENPLSGILDLDTLIPNYAMKEFMHYNAGVYHLLPSAHYGSWLSYIGPPLGSPTPMDQAETATWLMNVGGADGDQISTASTWHNSHDGFYTADGRIDMRAVIGTGLLTISGVSVAREPDGSTIETAILLGNGDATVPAKSATQGPPGTHNPLGDPVHVQAVCGVEHMQEAGNAKVTQRYETFLLQGRVPEKTEGDCQPSGDEVKVKNLDVKPEPIFSSLHATGAAGPSVTAAAEPAETLLEAWWHGHIQLIDLPGEPVAITNDSEPVDLNAGNGGEPVEIEIHHFNAGAEEPAEVWGPLSGNVEVRSGGSGAAVFDNGEPVSPNPPATAPGGNGSAGPLPASPPPQPPAAGTGVTQSAAVAVVGKVAPVKGRHALLSMHCLGSHPCRGTVKLIARLRSKRAGKRHARKHVRSVLIGKARFHVPAGRKAIVHVSLNGKGMHLVRSAGKRGLSAIATGSGVKRRAVRLERARRRKHAKSHSS